MTDHPFGSFTPADYQSRIRQDADNLIAAIRIGPLEASAPSCPGWTLRDVVEHVGGVHQWARLNITDPESAPAHSGQAPMPGEDLAEWYDRSVNELLTTLKTTDPERECWSLQKNNRVARFWSRRQSQELAIHRVDAEQAVGRPGRVDAALAADGIAEVLDVFVHRRWAWNVPPLDLRANLLIECTDRPERWLVVPNKGADVSKREPEFESFGPTLRADQVEQADVRMVGTASELLLVIWRRLELEASAIEIDGDVSVVQEMLAARLTP